MNIMFDIEGIILNKNKLEILPIITEISYVLFNEDEVKECFTTRLKYDLREYEKRLWSLSFNYVKKRFPNSFNGMIYSKYGYDKNIIRDKLFDIIDKYDATIIVKGAYLELQFLFGKLDEFHTPIKSPLYPYRVLDLNSFKCPKYDHIENKDIIIKEFYELHKDKIKTKLMITKEELFELNLEKYYHHHYSILEVIVFYELIKKYKWDLE